MKKHFNFPKCSSINHGASMTNYIRNNAWNNGGSFMNSDLVWYAKGVQKMMARPLNDTASWWFFAAMHGEYVDPGTAWYAQPPAFPDWGYIQGPPAVPVAPLPSADIRLRFWNQCQHGSWYFFPWHRGYLMALEAQLRADIIQLGGPSNWALPYWDYFGANGNQYGMPPAFSEPLLDGAANPLYCAMRYGPGGDRKVYIPTPAWEANDPQGPAPAYGAVTSTCLANDLYTGSDTKTPLPGFGGPASGFSHSGSPHGNMESNPHDLVHVYTGGEVSDTDYGLMADPGTAALDPIFYLHHSNIDRMWAQWIAAGNANPADAAWQKGPVRQFVMPWPASQPWVYTPIQVDNLAELDYSYQELAALAHPAANPLAIRLQKLGASSLADKIASGLAKPPSLQQPELLGASAGPVLIDGGGAQNIPIRMDAGVHGKVANSLQAIGANAFPDYVYLKLEGVRGTLDATVLDVFVNLPGQAQPKTPRANFAGQVSLFGLRRASVKDGEHGGGGLTVVLDITRLIDTLHLNVAFQPGSLSVSVIPRNRHPSKAKITIGRISAYRQGA